MLTHCTQPIRMTLTAIAEVAVAPCAVLVLTTPVARAIGRVPHN
jgi:hypothetical protein